MGVLEQNLYVNVQVEIQVYKKYILFVGSYKSYFSFLLTITILKRKIRYKNSTGFYKIKATYFSNIIRAISSGWETVNVAPFFSKNALERNPHSTKMPSISAFFAVCISTSESPI